MTAPLRWRWLGRTAHADALAVQQAARDRVLDGDLDAQVVLLAEHEPIITLGRNADADNVIAPAAELARRGVHVCRTSRGGDATYHGPGQLMVYPIVQLRTGLVAYLEAVATALAQVAASLGVPGAVWRRDPAGLWLGEAKLAACGVHLRRRVTLHGFALDVATPGWAWQLLNPCGMVGARTTSIARECATHGRPPPPSVAHVARMAGPIVCRVLDSVRVRGLPLSHAPAEPNRS